MKLVVISRVKNERDIIEAFVRHHAVLFDQLLVLDDGSTDGTFEILQALQAEGLPLVLFRDAAIGYEQSRHMTRLLRRAVRQHGADWVMPLDADEFVEPEPGLTLGQILPRTSAQPLEFVWHGFAWRAEHDQSLEPNPVVRMRERIAPSPQTMSKVLVPASLVTEDSYLGQGNHEMVRDWKPLPAERVNSVRLCHYPVRSVAQYAGKIAVGYLQYASTPGWDRRAGFHYLAPHRLLGESLDSFAAAMERDSLRYSFEQDWPDPPAPVDAPLDYRGGALTFSTQPVSPLVNVLHCAEAIAGKFAAGAGQIESAQRALLAAKGVEPVEAERILAQESDARSVLRHQPGAGSAGPQIFQSFWAGGPLTPYAAFCLRSFIDCGHAFELYSFDAELAVPAGVRLRDARELFGPDEYFVYSQDGFGHGSPSAFANLFRLKLLAEKGGWWVDTDVVCLAREIPAFDEFFAWEDGRLINNAVLYAKPRHPMIVACLAEAQRMGRSVRWGETGPVLTTRVAKELGYAHRAFASGVCYPLHYSEAIDALRPSRAENLRQRTADSLFVHLWSAMLRHRGVDETKLPTQGSILRAWIDRHPVDGWTGEYDAETLENALRPDAEPRIRVSADLALGIEDITRAAMAQREANSALRADNATLRAALENATLREMHLSSERDAYAAMSEHRRVEAETLRNSRSWKLTAPMRRARDWLRGERSAKASET